METGIVIYFPNAKVTDDTSPRLFIVRYTSIEIHT